jgi:hypothetical protein
MTAQTAERPLRCHECGGAIEPAKVLMWPDGVGTVICDGCGGLALLRFDDDSLRDR